AEASGTGWTGGGPAVGATAGRAAGGARAEPRRRAVDGPAPHPPAAAGRGGGRGPPPHHGHAAIVEPGPAPRHDPGRPPPRGAVSIGPLEPQRAAARAAHHVRLPDAAWVRPRIEQPPHRRLTSPFSPLPHTSPRPGVL